MLAIVLIVAITFGFAISFIYKRSSYVLSFFLVFTPLLPTLLKQVGVEGGAIITRYFFLLLVLLIIKRNWNSSLVIIKRNILVHAVILLIIGMIVFNLLSENNSDPLVFDFTFHSFLYCFIPFFLIIFLLNSPKFIADFLDSIPYWGVLFVFIFIFFFDFQNIDYGDRFTFVEITGFDTIASSRIFAITLIVSYMSLLKSKKFNIYLLASALLSLFFLLIVGQRGTIIGVVLGLTMFGFYNLKKNNFAIITGFVISISLLLFLRIIDLSSFEVFERFYELEKFREFERFQDYFTTWEIFENNSFWAGEGSYGYYFLTEREYPHNILLESISEYGLFGLISMMTIISTGLYYSIYLLRGKNILYEYKIIANIWIMLLISVLVSGNIVNNAIFFIFSGVLVLGYTLTKKTNKAHFRYNFLRFNSLNQLS